MVKPADRTRQGRLPRPGFADQCDTFTATDVEVDVVDNLVTGVRGVDTTKRQRSIRFVQRCEHETTSTRPVRHLASPEAADAMTERYLDDLGKRGVATLDGQLTPEREGASNRPVAW